MDIISDFDRLWADPYTNNLNRSLILLWRLDGDAPLSHPYSITPVRCGQITFPHEELEILCTRDVLVSIAGTLSQNEIHALNEQTLELLVGPDLVAIDFSISNMRKLWSQGIIPRLSLERTNIVTIGNGNQRQERSKLNRSFLTLATAMTECQQHIEECTRSTDSAMEEKAGVLNEFIQVRIDELEKMLGKLQAMDSMTS